MAVEKVSVREFTRNLDDFDDWFGSLDQNDTFKSKRHVGRVGVERSSSLSNVDDSDSDSDSDGSRRNENGDVRKKNHRTSSSSSHQPSHRRGQVERKTSNALELMMMQEKAKAASLPRSGSMGLLRDDSKKRALSLFNRKKATKATGKARRESIESTLACLLDGTNELMTSPVPAPKRSHSAPMEEGAAESTSGSGSGSTVKKAKSASLSPKPRRGGKKNNAAETPKRGGKKKVKSKSLEGEEEDKKNLPTTPKTPKKKEKTAAAKKKGDAEATPKKKKKSTVVSSETSADNGNGSGIANEATPKKKTKKVKATSLDGNEETPLAATNNEESATATTNNHKQKPSPEFVPPAPISFRAEIVAADQALMASKPEIHYNPEIPIMMPSNSSSSSPTQKIRKGKRPSKQQQPQSAAEDAELNRQDSQDSVDDDEKQEGDDDNSTGKGTTTTATTTASSPDDQQASISSDFVPPAPISFRADIVAADHALMASKPEIHYVPEIASSQTATATKAPPRRGKKPNKANNTHTAASTATESHGTDTDMGKKIGSPTTSHDDNDVKDDATQREKDLAERERQILEREKELDLAERERQIRERELELERKLKQLEKESNDDNATGKNKSGSLAQSEHGLNPRNRREAMRREDSCGSMLSQSDHGVVRSSNKNRSEVRHRHGRIQHESSGNNKSRPQMVRRNSDDRREGMLRREDSCGSMSQSDHGVRTSSNCPSLPRIRSEGQQTKWSNRGREDTLSQSDHALAESSSKLNLPSWRSSGRGGDDSVVSGISQSEHTGSLGNHLERDTNGSSVNNSKIWSTRACVTPAAAAAAVAVLYKNDDDDDDDDDVSISDSEASSSSAANQPKATEQSSRGRGRGRASAGQILRAKGGRSLSVNRRGSRSDDEDEFGLSSSGEQAAIQKRSRGTNDRPPLTSHSTPRKSRSVSRTRQGIPRGRSGDDLHIVDGNVPDSSELLCPKARVTPRTPRTPSTPRLRPSLSRNNSADRDEPICDNERSERSSRTSSALRPRPSLSRNNSADRDIPISENDNKSERSSRTSSAVRSRPSLSRNNSADRDIPITEDDGDRKTTRGARSASTGRLAGRRERGGGGPPKRNKSVGSRAPGAPHLRPTLNRDNSTNRSSSLGPFKKERRRGRKDDISEHLRNVLGGLDDDKGET